MIRVLASRERILQWLGEAKAANWMGRALQLSAENQRAGRHIKRANIWSEVKGALARFQHGKCAYCERLLGAAGVEWTVDHFRPKGSVVPYPEMPEGALDVGGHNASGYHLLAYDPDNFLGACQTCNNGKKNYFPTGRARRTDTTDSAELAKEEPYLINPGDPADVDPELAVVWKGPMPERGSGSAYDQLRAQVTIQVLGLAREHLIRERVLRIWGVMCACQLLDRREDPDIRAKLDALCSPGSPHASCVRSFRDLYETDPMAAKAVWDNECENWLVDSPAR